MAITVFWQWLLTKLSGRQTARERHEAATEAAKRRAEAAGTLFDAYPDREFKPHLRLVVIGSGVWQRVDLDGYGFEEINLKAARWRRELPGRLATAQQAAIAQGRTVKASRSTPSSSPSSPSSRSSR